MNDDGKAAAEACLKTLRADGQTNLWQATVGPTVLDFQPWKILSKRWKKRHVIFSVGRGPKYWEFHRFFRVCFFTFSQGSTNCQIFWYQYKNGESLIESGKPIMLQWRIIHAKGTDGSQSHHIEAWKPFDSVRAHELMKD